MKPMTPVTRRVLQAVLYEVVAVGFVGPAMGWIFDAPLASSTALAVVLATIAMSWSYIFNGLFERWEARQASRTRTFGRRLAHGAGFEGGLVLMLVPVMAWWLDIGLLEAFLADLGILAFFFVYAVAFTWCFDRVFGPPVHDAPGPARIEPSDR